MEALEERVTPVVADPTFVLFSVRGSPDASSAPVGNQPNQIRTAYGVNAVTLFNGQTADGTGQTIAIVDAYNNPDALSEMDGFDNGVYLTSSSATTLYQQYGAASSFLSVYNQFGTNITSSIANSGHSGVPKVDPTPPGPGADDWEVEEALDVQWAHSMAPGAKIDLVEANNSSLTNLLTAVKTAAKLAGVSVVSMSWGSAEFSTETSDDSTFTTPSGHQGVTFVASTGDSGSPGEWPAYSPNVVAIGGTSLTLTAGTNYQGETAWRGSGGGTSQYETEPAYQDGVQSTGYRTIPDVAFDANPYSGVAIYDSYNNGTGAPWEQIGGTSVSAPCWAALIAVTNQGRVLAGASTFNSSTNPTQTLTALYSLSSSDLHDIIYGSNGGNSAGPGYDEVTGLGTPIANLAFPNLSAYDVPIQVSSVVVNGDYAPIVDMSESGNTVTVTTDDNSGFSANNPVVVAGYSGTSSGYNGTWTIQSVDGNTFTYTATQTSLPTLTKGLGYALSTNSSSALIGNQRSMVDGIAYTFNQQVNLAAGAITMGLGTATTSGPTTLASADPNAVLTSLNGGSIWVVTWGSAAGNTVVGHSIADGVYTITLNSADVTAVLDGSPMTSTRPTDTFFRMFGNVVGYSTSLRLNGTGTASLISSDTLQVNHTYLLSTGTSEYLAYCDYNGDGTINSTDTLQINRRYLGEWSAFTPTI